MTVKFDEKTEDLLAELEELQKAERYPNIDRPTAEYLYDLVMARKPKLIVEVGAANGYSAIWFALAAREFGGKVITYECGIDRHTELMKNISRAGLENIIDARHANAREDLMNIAGPIDFAFIDATKAEYLDYLKLMEPKLSPGAIVAADNIISHGDRLQDFIGYAKMNYPGTRIIDIGKGLMLIEKK